MKKRALRQMFSVVLALCLTAGTLSTPTWAAEAEDAPAVDFSESAENPVAPEDLEEAPAGKTDGSPETSEETGPEAVPPAADASPAQEAPTAEEATFEWMWDDSTRTLFITGHGDVPFTAYTLWFDQKPLIREVVVGEGIRSIGDSAFSDCPLLTRVSLPSTLESLGGSVFNNCKALTELELPASLREIGYEIGRASWRERV